MTITLLKVKLSMQFTYLKESLGLLNKVVFSEIMSIVVCKMKIYY